MYFRENEVLVDIENNNKLFYICPTNKASKYGDFILCSDGKKTKVYNTSNVISLKQLRQYKINALLSRYMDI